MLQGTLTKRKVEGNKIGGDALVLLNSKERKVAVRKERVIYTQIRVEVSSLKLSTPLKVVNISRIKVWLSLKHF